MGFLLLRMKFFVSPEMGPCLTEPQAEEIGGVRLVRAYSQGLAFAILLAAPASRSTGPFDAKGKTTGGCAVYQQVVDCGMGKKFFDCRLEFSVGHILQSDEAAAASVGLERAGATAQLLGKAGVLRITRASIRVDIDRARLWKRFDTGEAIIGK